MSEAPDRGNITRHEMRSGGRQGMTLGEAFPASLAAARAGAQWAWVRLYDDVSPVVLGYLRARGAAEPEDLTGEVFLQVVRDLHRFEGSERDFRAWVLSVAHHRLVDDRRYRSRRPVEPWQEDLLVTAPGSDDPEHKALENLSTDRVMRIMSALTPDQQDVLLLRILADLTIEEVAHAVGKRPGAVKALQRRGLAAIKRQLFRLGVTL